MRQLPSGWRRWQLLPTDRVNLAQTKSRLPRPQDAIGRTLTVRRLADFLLLLSPIGFRFDYCRAAIGVLVPTAWYRIGRLLGNRRFRSASPRSSIMTIAAVSS